MKTVTLSEEIWETITEALDSYRDCGPEGEDWASDKVLNARACLAKALTGGGETTKDK